jgi:hypothetical protein
MEELNVTSNDAALTKMRAPRVVKHTPAAYQDVPEQEFNPEEKKGKVNLHFQQAKDAEMVRGIFRFHECPGGNLSFKFRQYKGEIVTTYTLTDGVVSNIPLGVAKHINKDMWYPIHEHATDAQGKPLIKMSKKVQRASFQSLEFMEIEDFEASGTALFAPNYSRR